MTRFTSLKTLLPAALLLLPTFAQAAISGGFDPETTVSAGGTWLLTVFGGVLWVVIFLIRGIQLGLSGRAGLPQLGYAFAGAVVFFGATFAMLKLGIG